MTVSSEPDRIACSSIGHQEDREGLGEAAMGKGTAFWGGQVEGLALVHSRIVAGLVNNFIT
jgi:hypothetical protein